MNGKDGDRQKDKRLLVLLALGALIVLSGFFCSGIEKRTPDRYYGSPAAAARAGIVALAAGEGNAEPGPDLVLMNAKPSCRETPPELALFFDLPMPVNRATGPSLAMLPGIGPTLADNIIRFREEQGKIEGPSDLERIKGIGKKKAARLSPMLCYELK